MDGKKIAASPLRFAQRLCGAAAIFYYTLKIYSKPQGWFVFLGLTSKKGSRIGSHNSQSIACCQSSTLKFPVPEWVRNAKGFLPETVSGFLCSPWGMCQQSRRRSLAKRSVSTPHHCLWRLLQIYLILHPWHHCTCFIPSHRSTSTYIVRLISTNLSIRNLYCQSEPEKHDDVKMSTLISCRHYRFSASWLFLHLGLRVFCHPCNWKSSSLWHCINLTKKSLPWGAFFHLRPNWGVGW